jgi:hypothetical protein
LAAILFLLSNLWYGYFQEYKPVRQRAGFFVVVIFDTYLQANFLNLFMQVQVDINFDQLVQIAKKLPDTQWLKLKSEVEKDMPIQMEPDADFIKLLLSGPTFSEEQLTEIAETRKAINQWRTK